MKKRTFLLSILCASIGSLVAQETSDWSYKFSGFVDPQVYFDTREVVGAREEQLLFYPAPKKLDTDGNDINAQPSLNMLAITTRVGCKIGAPDALNAKLFGYVEGDFTGSTNDGINMLRLRHAYINMRWDKSQLLLGQYWHPIVAHEVMPGTRPLNMGVPFHPYSRYVQTRYTYFLGELELSGTLAFQLDNKATGPEGSSTAYLRNSCIPELNAQLCYRTSDMLLGATFNYVVLKPRNQVTTLSGTYKVDEKIGSAAFSVFGKFNISNYSLRFQGIVGNNLFEQLMMGGYTELVEGKKCTYENFGTTTIWADFGSTSGSWRPGIFVGYGVNNSFGNSIHSAANVYGRGINIAYLWRVQPRIGYYPTKHLNLFAEIEYTNACYGKIVQYPMSTTYKYEKDYNIGNCRFILAASFNF